MSKMFKNIVAPVDFSKASVRSLGLAFEMAQAGGRVIVCHVVDDIPLSYGYAEATGVETRSKLARSAEEEVKRLAQDSALDGVEWEAKVLHGAPFKEILELANREQADLIVLGTHGHSGIAHVLLGSVAERVIRTATCPVLVVGPHGAEVTEAR